MASSLPNSTTARLNRANWHPFALSKIKTGKELSRVKKWLKENCAGEYYATPVKETVGSRLRTIATLVRVKEDDDALMFKLHWVGWE